MRPDGALQARYQYDAWGNPRSTAGSSFNVFGFTGHERDEATGLYYFKARYYDPETGRFLTEDPFEGTRERPPSLHRYLYAYQNPTVYADPMGSEGEKAAYKWKDESDIPAGTTYYFDDRTKTYYSADPAAWDDELNYKVTIGVLKSEKVQPQTKEKSWFEKGAETVASWFGLGEGKEAVGEFKAAGEAFDEAIHNRPSLELESQDDAARVSDISITAIKKGQEIVEDTAGAGVKVAEAAVEAETDPKREQARRWWRDHACQGRGKKTRRERGRRGVSETRLEGSR